MSQNVSENELLDVVAASQILSARLSLCSAWLGWPSLCFWPLPLITLPTAWPRLELRGALEIRSVQVLTWQLEVGEEFQPWEKVEEAAAEPGGAAGSAGSARPPGRGLWLCLLRGELGGKGTPALQTRCALRFHWFLVQKFRAWWHYELVFFFPIIIEEDENIPLRNPRHSWLHGLGINIPILFFKYIYRKYIYF